MEFLEQGCREGIPAGGDVNGQYGRGSWSCLKGKGYWNNEENFLKATPLLWL